MFATKTKPKEMDNSSRQNQRGLGGSWYSRLKILGTLSLFAILFPLLLRQFNLLFSRQHTNANIEAKMTTTVNKVIEVEELKLKPDDEEAMLALVPLLQPVVSLPTNNRPFAFFHNRKGGGSTLRSAIYNAARNNKLTDSNLWVPCHGSVPCVHFEHIPRESYRAIYASHINYEELVRARRQMIQSLRVDNKENNDSMTLSSGKNATYYHLKDDRHHFDCLTNIRQTVSRVVSCYNFRFLQTKKKSWDMPHADEMTPDDWTALLPQAYDTYAGGCNNELLRTFGSLNDEEIINTFTKDSPYFESELRHAAGRMARCIIVDLHRCEESNAVLRHYLPWLGHSLDLCTGHENVGKTSSNHTRIREGSAEAILAQNEFDESLFRFGTKLFDAQLKFAQSVLR